MYAISYALSPSTCAPTLEEFGAISDLNQIDVHSPRFVTLLLSCSKKICKLVMDAHASPANYSKPHKAMRSRKDNPPAP